MREALALTCATQIGTWPLTAAVFSTLAPYAILANALVVPLIALVLLGGIATLVLPVLAPLETLLLLTVEQIVRVIASFPGARATLATPPFCAIVAYDAGRDRSGFRPPRRTCGCAALADPQRRLPRRRAAEFRALPARLGDHAVSTSAKATPP